MLTLHERQVAALMPLLLMLLPRYYFVFAATLDAAP